MGESTTYVIKAKCGDCSLHFCLYTWNKLWLQEHVLHCPECGSERGFLLWQEPIEELFIFELVPGPTPLVAMGRTPMPDMETVLDETKD